ncbi:hypothetical protein M514_07507 [Trichuris suis]|uniref:Uncharacterized protein n=1 Tax=Trichuris suis TaxID=68888 RepID=A0A085M332_9BILA|nr:hypothetical protein M513_07507 [Trichuris suis]KFD67766.1 hypothetical protein M514_07507 [Trichuris suis]KHJ41239.1 eukaryotic porin [Trichuris suis]
MAPPFFNQLGQSAYDIFRSGFNVGKFFISGHTRPQSDVELEAKAFHTFDTDKLFGSVNAKFAFGKYGITMKETWNTDNQLTSEVIFKDPYAKGLLVKGESTFSPLSRKRTLKASAEYLSEALALHAQLDGSATPFLFRLGAVFGYEKFLFGYEAGINVNNQSFTYNHIALGYRTENFQLHSFANNSSEFGGTAYQRVNKNMEVGTMVGWTVGEPGATFGVGTRLTFDNGRVLQAKISNKSELGICLREKIHDACRLIFSVAIDLKQFNTGSHAVGFGIEYCQPCCEQEPKTHEHVHTN